MRGAALWLPAMVMGVGAMLVEGIDVQLSMPLVASLDSVIPREVADFVGEDVKLSADEVRVAGVDEYLMRNYSSQVPGDSSWFSLYIGYYERQARGRTIHTPKNCLPGSGWEALASEAASIDTEVGRVSVNRYLLQKGSQSALVLYWYQGRGRIESNEYIVKWDLLRDSALRQRSDEALVRIVVPVQTDAESAFSVASRVAQVVIPALKRSLPK